MVSETCLILNPSDYVLKSGTICPCDKAAYHKANIVMVVKKNGETLLIKNKWGAVGKVV